jgi:Ubiquitin carboxyl-terminal hydrolase, family 1
MLINQLVNSGSVTQAFIAAVLNMPEHAVGSIKAPDIGHELKRLRRYAKAMTPLVRGAAVCSSAAVRAAHNSAAAFHSAPQRRQDFQPETELADLFWMYGLYMMGRSCSTVYHMDGCAQEPHFLGHVVANGRSLNSDVGHGNQWLQQATSVVSRQITEMRLHHIPFELYAIVEDPSPATPKPTVEPIEANGHAKREMTDDKKDRVDSGSTDASELMISGSGGGTAGSKPKRRKRESCPERERAVATHNYDTFVLEMMKLMASRGDLNSLIERAYIFAPSETPTSKQKYNGSSRTSSE